jgi:1-acyl-sn-glycerol-3-phosphate acyltransferase
MRIAILKKMTLESCIAFLLDRIILTFFRTIQLFGLENIPKDGPGTKHSYLMQYPDTLYG